MDQQEFDRKLKELQEKYPLQPVPEGDFSQTNLENFCTDLSEFITALLTKFREKFTFFYNTIMCTITGDKLKVVSVDIKNDCPDLWQYFYRLDPPASVRLRFTLTNSRIPEWGTIHKDIFIYFRYHEFEVSYNVPTADPLSRIKNYWSNFFDIIDLFADQLRGDFLSSMSNRDGRD